MSLEAEPDSAETKRRQREDVFAANPSQPFAGSRKPFPNSAAGLFPFDDGIAFGNDAGGHEDRKHTGQLMNFQVSRPRKPRRLSLPEVLVPFIEISRP
jgi:hypothetical protein